MPSGFGMSVGLEGDAKILRVYQPDVMFGLFQTAAYARAQFEIAKPIDERTTEFVERNIEIRMRRKEAITRTDRPVEVHAILEEAVCGDVFGGPDVMREQYAHLGGAGRAGPCERADPSDVSNRSTGPATTSFSWSSSRRCHAWSASTSRTR